VSGPSGAGDAAGRGIDDLAGDFLSGWTVGAGLTTTENQAGLAAQFYLDATGATSYFDPAPSNVILTGHSLGGGLAGFVASLSHATAIVYDHMPFGLAALGVFADKALQEFSKDEDASALFGVSGGAAATRYLLLQAAVPLSSPGAGRPDGRAAQFCRISGQSANAAAAFWLEVGGGTGSQPISHQDHLDQ
jgi:hypothetical protein